jgi:hypothetical protein
MVQLTDIMIETAFDELAIDSKYFDKFKEVVERSYSEQQRDYPNDDEDESNADVSIRFSIEFMKYYVPEKEKGHCDSWADTYARNRCCQIVEYISYREAYDAIVEKEDREKELDIHVASMSTDSLFKKRYKYLFTKIDGDPKEAAENYCNDYRRMIALGKSEIYARAYADYHDGCKEEFSIIYAQAYELANKHGMDGGEAYRFGETCATAVDQGIWSYTNEFLKLYHEEWQKDFYFTLIKMDFEETEHRKMSQQEEVKIRKSLFG